MAALRATAADSLSTIERLIYWWQSDATQKYGIRMIAFVSLLCKRVLHFAQPFAPWLWNQ